MKRRKDSEPSRVPGTRPPEYVIVVAAGRLGQGALPGQQIQPLDALHAGKDPEPEPRPDPEPDLEAEP